VALCRISRRRRSGPRHTRPTAKASLSNHLLRRRRSRALLHLAAHPLHRSEPGYSTPACLLQPFGSNLPPVAGNACCACGCRGREQARRCRCRDIVTAVGTYKYQLQQRRQAEEHAPCWPYVNTFTAHDLTLLCIVPRRLVGGVPARQAGLAGVGGWAAAMDVIVIAAGCQCASGVSYSGVAVDRTLPRRPATLCSRLEAACRRGLHLRTAPAAPGMDASAVPALPAPQRAPAFGAVGGGHAARGHRRTRVSRSHSSARSRCNVLRIGFPPACHVHPLLAELAQPFRYVTVSYHDIVSHRHRARQRFAGTAGRSAHHGRAVGNHEGILFRYSH
jgi:hypothetical protein